jgi:hypothetical protein
MRATAHSFAGAHAQQVDFEFRERGQDVEEHLSHRVGRVVDLAAKGQLDAASQASEVCQNQLRLKVCGAPAFQQAATTNEIVRDASISTTPQMSTVAQLRKRTTATP